MAELYLKPARAGDIIRDPLSGRPLPPEGEVKPRNLHWLRRLGRREVEETKPEEIAKGKAACEAAEKKAAAEAAPVEKAAAEPDTKTRKGKE